MAITDLDVFAHLTDADIENLGVELDAIRQDIAGAGRYISSLVGSDGFIGPPAECDKVQIGEKHRSMEPSSPSLSASKRVS